MAAVLKPMTKELESTSLSSYLHDQLTFVQPSCLLAWFSGVDALLPNAKRFAHPDALVALDWIENEGHTVIVPVLEKLSH